MTTGGRDDLVALERDAALFDALAARAPTPGDDPAVRLLAALAAEADDPTPTGDDPPRTVLAAARARRFGARGAVAFGVAVSVMSATGVAAAVAGSPLTRLTPLEAVIRSVQGEKAAPSAQEPPTNTAEPGGGPLVPGAKPQGQLQALPGPGPSADPSETPPTPTPTPTADPSATDPLPTTTTDPALDPSTTTDEEPAPDTTTDETATPEPTATSYPGNGRSQAQPRGSQGVANGLSGR